MPNTTLKNAIPIPRKLIKVESCSKYTTAGFIRKMVGMKILAIETSCDETALALIEASGGLRTPKFKILKNLVSSQIEIHRPWGGVVPNLAKRNISKTFHWFLRES